MDCDLEEGGKRVSLGKRNKLSASSQVAEGLVRRCRRTARLEHHVVNADRGIWRNVG